MRWGCRGAAAAGCLGPRGRWPRGRWRRRRATRAVRRRRSRPGASPLSSVKPPLGASSACHLTASGDDGARCPSAGTPAAGCGAALSSSCSSLARPARASGLVNDLLRPLRDRCVVALGVARAPRRWSCPAGCRGTAAAARAATARFSSAGRVVDRRPVTRPWRPELGLAQQVLAAAVALLGPGLAGVGAAVQLEVHLATPDRRVGILGLGLAGRRPPVSRSVSRRRALQ